MAKKIKKKEIYRLVRIPREIDDYIQKRAINEQRSINGQIVHEISVNQKLTEKTRKFKEFQP